MKNNKVIFLGEDNKQVENKLASGVTAIHVVTANCHGILNTILQAPAQKPDWFDGLNDEMNNAKDLSKEWINDIAPEISSRIPLYVIDYSNQFEASINEILRIIDENPKMKKGDKDFDDVNDILNCLIEEIDENIIKDIEKSKNDLKNWGSKFQDSHNKIKEKVGSIQDTIIDTKGDMQKLKVSIDALNKEIARCNIAIGAGAIGICAGVFVTLVGTVVCVATGGAGGLVVGAGVLMIVGGAVTWGVMQSKINNKLDEITEAQKNLKKDEAFIGSLSAIDSSTQNVLAFMENALAKLTDIQTMWNSFSGQIKETVKDLEKAEESASVILKKVFTNTALNNWKNVEQFAMDLAEVKLEIVEKELA